MEQKKDNTTSRRQWFIALGRWSAAGILSVVSMKLLGRKDSGEQPCTDPRGRIGCRGCSELTSCALPRGLSFKQFLGRNNAEKS